MQLDIEDDKLIVHANPMQVEMMKRVPGSRYDAKRQLWTVPAEYPLFFAVIGEFPGKAEPTDAVKEWVAAAWQTREVGPLAAYTQHRTEIDWEEFTLAPLQHAAIAWAERVEGAVIADDMGTGKTVMASVLISEHERTIVVCPKSLTGSWVSHVEAWASKETHVAVGSVTQRRKAIASFKENGGVLVINYSTLAAHSRLLSYGSVAFKKCTEHGGIDPKLKPEKCQVHEKELNDIDIDFVVFDEAHRMKDPKTIQTRAGWYLGKQAKRRLAMTGTPVSESPADFWSLLRLVDPDAWPSKTRFLGRYCLLAENYATGGTYVVGLNPENAEEFHRIKDMYMLRRTFDEVAPHKIEKVYYLREVSLTPAKMSLYNKFKNDPFVEIEDELLMLDNSAVRNVRLMQACSGAKLGVELVPGPDGEMKQTIVYRDNAAKTLELWDFWNDIDRVPLVVFAGGPGSRLLLDNAIAYFEEKKIPVSAVVGGMSTQMRDEAVTRYMDGETDVFFGQSQAAGEGLNLDRHNQLAVLQSPASLVERKQLEDRIRRMTQKANQVFITDIVSLKTFDSRLQMIYRTKEAMFEEFTLDSEKLEELY